MRNEMKMGLGIGLLVLVSVVGLIIINQGEDDPSQEGAITDAGSSAESDAVTAQVGDDEEVSTVSEADSGIRQTGFGSARRAERDGASSTRRSAEHDAFDHDTSDAAQDAISDAAEAPATDSEGVGSPSPSNIPTGMSRTDRPGLADSTDAVTDALGWGGASSADVEQDSGTDRADVEDASVTRDEAGSGLADADRDDATRATSDRGRTAPSAEDTATEDASTDASAPASIATSHTIEPGDTFSGLAVRYFGHAKYAGLISDANPEVDPRRLHVGKSVKIPDTPHRKERQTEASETAGTVASSAGSQGGAHSSSVARSDETSPRAETSLPPIPEDRKYVVKATDRGWYDLAERLLGDSSEWTMLYEFNKERLPDPRNRDLLPVGLEIEIPEMK